MANLKYIRGYEVKGVNPLSHYFQEIYGQIKGIADIGPRGDQNYFWYSKDYNGAAYYEVGEQQKSAESAYQFFLDPANRSKYLEGVRSAIDEEIAVTKELNETDFSKLSLPELIQLSQKTLAIDAKVFSYYLISMPYRLQRIEDEVRGQLEQRVASSRIDLYLARITAPEELTLTAQEELGWSKLVLEGQKSIHSTISPPALRDGYKELADKILKHYDMYKTLALGDGNWEFDAEAELKRYCSDLMRDASYFEDRIAEIEGYTSKTLAERQQVIHELNIDDKTVEVIEFLAHVSHARYSMRAEGFIPLIHAEYDLFNELGKRLGYKGFDQYVYLTYEELQKTNKAGKQVVPPEEIARREGNHHEFMVRINNGVVEYHYGDEATKLFEELMPKVDHSETIEVSGVAAEHGEVEAMVTVYQWGDDMDEALANIKQHPILIAGQTRPSMMPIIREAQGIVTDEGGVTSHAAIVARELKIPAVINTHDATKVFKTGDRVLLDATNGIIRKVQ